MQRARLLKKFSIIILLLISVLLTVPTARGHELKTDEKINALLHINPDDDPIVGQTSELLFLINDKDKKFTRENCDCRASVKQNNETLFSSPLFQGKTSYRGIFAPAIPYTFPQKGVYTVTLTGEPKTTGTFQAFSLSYNVRVERDATIVKKNSQIQIMEGIGVILMLITLIYIMKKFFIQPNTPNQ